MCHFAEVVPEVPVEAGADQDSATAETTLEVAEVAGDSACDSTDACDVASVNTEPVNPAAKEAHIDAANIHVAVGTIASRVRTPHPVAEKRRGRHHQRRYTPNGTHARLAHGQGL